VTFLNSSQLSAAINTELEALLKQIEMSLLSTGHDFVTLETMPALGAEIDRDDAASSVVHVSAVFRH
jgi:hypothetical protein